MKVEDALKKMPREGFIKVSEGANVSIRPDQRAALFRKGNELFNAGQFDQAKRLFMTAGYSDGMIRLGDHYYKKNDPFEALRMYMLAHAGDRIEKMMNKFSAVVQQWLHEEQGRSNNEKGTVIR